MSATKNLGLCAIACAALAAVPAAASTVVPAYGGIFVDAFGLNGERLRSFTAADALNKGAVRGDPETNDFFIGEQDGFDMGLLDQLGGGFASLSLRLTVFDADNDPDNFDFNDNFLRVNDVILGNFSEVITTTTDADGNVINGLNDGIGFGGDETDTGTFTVTDSATLATLFASLQQTSTMSFEIDKRDINGNFFDFTSPSRIPGGASGFGPQIAVVPLPAGLWFMLVGLGGLGMLRKRKVS